MPEIEEIDDEEAQRVEEEELKRKQQEQIEAAKVCLGEILNAEIGNFSRNLEFHRWGDFRLSNFRVGVGRS